MFSNSPFKGLSRFNNESFGDDLYSEFHQEGGVLPPPLTDSILQDNGDFLLQDNGDLLLEG